MTNPTKAHMFNNSHKYVYRFEPEEERPMTISLKNVDAIQLLPCEVHGGEGSIMVYSLGNRLSVYRSRDNEVLRREFEALEEALEDSRS